METTKKWWRLCSSFCWQTLGPGVHGDSTQPNSIRTLYLIICLFTNYGCNAKHSANHLPHQRTIGQRSDVVCPTHNSHHSSIRSLQEKRILKKGSTKSSIITHIQRDDIYAEGMSLVGVKKKKLFKQKPGYTFIIEYYPQLLRGEMFFATGQQLISAINAPFDFICSDSLKCSCHCSDSRALLLVRECSL